MDPSSEDIKHPASPVQPATEAPLKLRESIDALYKQIDISHVLVSDLYELLDPVLQQDSSREPVEKNSVREGSSAAVESVLAAINSLQSLQDKLRDLCCRVAI